MATLLSWFEKFKAQGLKHPAVSIDPVYFCILLPYLDSQCIELSGVILFSHECVV